MNHYINPQNLSRKLSALAHPSRVAIILQLGEGEKNVSELCQLLNKDQPYISQHLRLLNAHGIVKQKRDGQKVFYSTSKEICNWLLSGQFVFLEEDKKELERNNLFE